MTIANRLAKLREEKELSKSKLAELLGIPYSTYNHYEIGDREPNSETLRIISEFYGETMDYIMLGKTEKYKSAELTNDEEKLLNLFRNSTDIGRGMALGILMSHQKDNDNGIGIKKNA